MGKGIFFSNGFWTGVLVGLIIIVLVGGEDAIVYTFQGFMFLYSLWLIKMGFEGLVKKIVFKHGIMSNNVFANLMKNKERWYKFASRAD